MADVVPDETMTAGANDVSGPEADSAGGSDGSNAPTAGGAVDDGSGSGPGSVAGDPFVGGGNLYDDMRFTVEPGDGPADLTVRAYAFTLSGEPLPEGTFEWAIDDETESGPMSTHADIVRVFRAGGLHMVRLSLTIAGVTQPIGCSQSPGARVDYGQVTVWPTICGAIYDPNGDPVVGAQVAVWDTDLTTTTDAAGRYAIAVPYSSSGLIVPTFDACAFAPAAWSFSSLVNDVSGVEFKARCTPSPPPNHPPQAFDQSVETLEDETVDVTLAGEDPDEDPLAFMIAALPEHGALLDTQTGQGIDVEELPYALSPGQSRVTYVPAADYNGSDDFEFLASDGVDDSGPQTATVSLSVAAVNDPPTFVRPADQSTSLGAPLNVQVGPVSPGPTDEAGQVVRLVATSSDLTIIPDGNLVFSGTQLSVTPIAAGGPVTVSIIAQDDGGTRVGGVGTSWGTFRVTVISDPLVSGTVSPSATVGAQPPVGPVELQFVGSGASAGLDFDATTDVSGSYSVAVPAGWTGTLSAADPGDVFLSPVAIVFDEPITVPLVDQDFFAWRPPIGVPTPEFGIREVVNLPDPWSGPVAGFYYVDNTHPDATDSDNPNGYPEQPRLSIPGLMNLEAGTVIYVAGGSYFDGGSRYVTGTGTAEAPIVIMGNPAEPPHFATKLCVLQGASYVIVENIEFDGTLNDYAGMDIVQGAYHVAVRNCDLHDRQGTCLQIYGSVDEPVHDVVVFNCRVHDNGDWLAEYDQDYHGINVKAFASYVWVLDNELYHNSGNGIQVNAGSLERLPLTHHLYIARNEGHHNKQAAIALKQCSDAIVSQNAVHDQRPIGESPSDWGSGVGFQYGPENVWFLCNHIYDCCYGIYAGSTSGMGDGQNSYFIGNVIHDIHHDPAYAYNPGSAWSNAALTLIGVPHRYIVNNTVYSVDAGINGPSGGLYEMVNNVIVDVTESAGNHIFIENGDAADAAVVQHNLFYQGGDPVRIQWAGSTVYDLAAFQSATGKGEGCINADPLFVDAEARDLHIAGDSAAVNAGVDHAAYTTFFDLYGIDIAVDVERYPRPDAGGMDMGAFEWRP